MRPVVVLSFFAGAMFLLQACASAPAPVAESMTYEECQHASRCQISGVLHLRSVDLVQMGRLNLDDGRCINVSLPDNMIEELGRRMPKRQVIKGRVFIGGHRDESAWSMVIEGRKVAISQCGDFYIFVD